ncbi:O-fucosyltransferase 30-like [Musa acuminata AAA Group]|uniref:(wild Malaysian banana) hypothetical protein n=1 Tax=Musa acuminata subsp. malaccensis TaxID=214687 RepID=A0A804IRS2_MUSAM|nr:PREDICTED: uncharacterized protein LOC103985288 [Musa acuminata subsp. malaccensis]XP_009401330.1 PREDICTED: uncharacterized protein LOC103985288 [Musa acuminata subsp. malaccensis]XP_018673803.1 PREDICTED: uncharacterized protein LOC103985288 [Musa acuminata subsp. malaccensis]CAG1842819.1 unnamed protein product [Musa acuminata subsp. malaccensis]
MSRWRKRSPRNKPLFFLSVALLVLFALFLAFCLSSTADVLRSLLPSSSGTLDAARSTQCGFSLRGERFLWFAPHSGFSNQVSELKNAILFAAILNRTLIVPPVLDHHAVVLGSCPKFRVSSPTELRTAVWDHIMELVRDRRYVSMGDIIDLSVVTSSMVRTVDFRIFASAWCGLNMEQACSGGLCCAISGIKSAVGNFDQCRSLLSGLQGNNNQCTYAVEDDCRTTVWTYLQDNDETLDSFQAGKELLKKKKISYVRKRRSISKALGPGSKAAMSPILAFGTLFSAPYRGSESYIDIHEVPGDPRIQSLLKKMEFIPFAPEILAAGKEFALNKIRKPFLCAQLRLLDGQFKNHWKTTFSTLEQKLKSLELKPNQRILSDPINIFLMTDLPSVNWTGTYLADLAKDSTYQLYSMEENSELVMEAAKRLMASENGIRSSVLPRNYEGSRKKKACNQVLLPDILLYIEESVCSCASLGFVGTAGSTIAENIELMRKKNTCKL